MAETERMYTPYDVDPEQLIQNAAQELEDEYEAIAMPDWARYVKSGKDKERPPRQQNWWHLRAAATLRKVYTKGPVGTERLRRMFGGRERRGHAPEHFAKASGKVTRTILQQIEAAGLVETVEGEGRKITADGQRLLDNLSMDIAKEAEETAAEA